MDESTRASQSTDDKLLHMIEKQLLTKEGSSDWYELQGRINQIIAENFLRFLNR